MKVRLKTAAKEAHQYLGDLDDLRAWIASMRKRATDVRPLSCAMARVEDGRFAFTLAVGDWLIADGDKRYFTKCRVEDFPERYEVAT